MTLPPWHPKTDEERQAFIDRVHDELLAERLKGDDRSIELLTDMMTRERIARMGYKLEPDKKPGPPITKDRSTPLEQALADALLMPAIFYRLWKRRNRTSDPSRPNIAASIWGLSPDERNKLDKILKHEN